MARQHHCVAQIAHYINLFVFDLTGHKHYINLYIYYVNQVAYDLQLFDSHDTTADSADNNLLYQSTFTLRSIPVTGSLAGLLLRVGDV